MYVGRWSTRGLEKDGAAVSSWITCSGDRKPLLRSTHHLARPYLPAHFLESVIHQGVKEYSDSRG